MASLVPSTASQNRRVLGDLGVLARVNPDSHNRRKYESYTQCHWVLSYSAVTIRLTQLCTTVMTICHEHGTTDLSGGRHAFEKNVSRKDAEDAKDLNFGEALMKDGITRSVNGRLE